MKTLNYILIANIVSKCSTWSPLNRLSIAEIWWCPNWFIGTAGDSHISSFQSLQLTDLFGAVTRTYGNKQQKMETNNYWLFDSALWVFNSDDLLAF